jgi:Uma2 family endonuclease
MLGVPQVPLGRPATYQDLVALPDHVVAEIIDGDLYASPRPAPTHAWVHSWLGGLLLPPYGRGHGGPGGWIILYEPELHLGADVLVPDLAGWRRERMPRLPDTAYFALAPDWICEVLSPSTASIDRAKKLRIYGREGVAHAWLLDPIAQTLEAFELEAGRWMVLETFAGSSPVRVRPFEAVALDLGLLWSDTAPVPPGDGR